METNDTNQSFVEQIYSLKREIQEAYTDESNASMSDLIDMEADYAGMMAEQRFFEETGEATEYL